MLKSSLLLWLTLLAFSAARAQTDKQGYAPKVNSQGNLYNQLRTDSAQHIPHKYGQTLNTTDTTPQIYVWTTPSGDSLVIFVNGRHIVVGAGQNVANAGGALSMQSGTYAGLPLAGIAGRFYAATDSAFWLFDNGSVWINLSGSGGGGGPGTVVSAKSVTGDGSSGSPLQLVNDALTPGNLKYYGTDASGVKGYNQLGTAAFVDKPVSGNASGTQVVMGNDSRLTDARNANALQGKPISGTAPTSGQVLQYDGTDYVPTTPGPGGVFYVNSFGAIPDGRQSFTFSATNGSTTATCSDCNFSSVNIGQSIRIDGAGPSGTPYVGTIASVTNATTIVLGAAAGTTAGTLKGVYGSDNTVAVQAAINACAPVRGGVVQFGVGWYIVAGALQTSIGGTNPNCQLYMPPIQYTAGRGTIGGQGIGITIQGAFAPNLSQQPLGDTAFKASGTVIYSIIEGSASGSTVMPAIFGSRSNDPTDLDINGVDWTFRDLTLMVPYNTTIGGIDGYFASTTSTYNLAVLDDYSGTNFFDHGKPTGDVAAIVTNEVGSEILSDINKTWISGFKYGLVTSDHVHVNYASIFMCQFARVFSTSVETQHDDHLDIQWTAVPVYIPASAICNNMVQPPGGSLPNVYFSIDMLGMELFDAFGNWNDVSVVLSDSANAGRGNINYAVAKATCCINPTTQNLFSKFGGDSVQCYNIGKPNGGGGGGSITSSSGSISVSGSDVNVNAGHSNTYTVGQSFSSLEVSPSASGEAVRLSNTNNTATYGIVNFFPSSGTNAAPFLQLIPKGTGSSFGDQAGINMFNTDFMADPVNYELMTMKGSGAAYIFNAEAGGTGAVRPLKIQMGGSDAVTFNTNKTLLLNDYGTGSHTGTAAFNLSVDASGNVIETTAGGGSSPPFDANTALVSDHTDPTKLLKFDVSAIPTGTTRTWTYPSASGTAAATNLAQTYTQPQTFGTTHTDKVIAGGFYRAFAHINSSLATTYTAALTDNVITVDCTTANVTITLPSSATGSGLLVNGDPHGIEYIISKEDASGHTVTVVVNNTGTETINGATSFTLTSQYSTAHVVCTTGGNINWLKY